MDTLFADLKFAIRSLARRPGFALVAVLTLAVGIGANTAVYSIAEAVLLRPLPFRDPERLVMVWERNVARDRTRNVVNPGNYLAWRDRNAVFEDIAAFAPFSMNLTGDHEPAAPGDGRRHLQLLHDPRGRPRCSGGASPPRMRS